jgi:transcriptional regulator with XRE-family HTH domain
VLDGKEIRKKRDLLGLSARELADLLNVDKANLYKWEKGHMPSDPTDYIKIENWLKNGHAESVPKSTISGSLENKNEDQLNMVLPLGDLKVTLKDHFDLLKQIADEAKKEKERLYNLLENKLADLVSNSKTILADLQDASRMTRADDLTMMRGTDRILGREDGASAKEAHILERALGEDDEETDTKDSDNKQSMQRKAKK